MSDNYKWSLRDDIFHVEMRPDEPYSFVFLMGVEMLRVVDDKIRYKNGSAIYNLLYAQ